MAHDEEPLSGHEECASYAGLRAELAAKQAIFTPERVKELVSAYEALDHLCGVGFASIAEETEARQRISALRAQMGV